MSAPHHTSHCLALVTDGFGGRGGIAQYNRDFLTAAAEAPDIGSVEVIARFAPDPVVLPVKTRQGPARASRIRYVIDALAAAMRGRPEILFCGHLFMAPLGWALARLVGARFVLQTHGVEVWTRPSVLQRWAVGAADMVLCVSRHTRDCVLSWSSLSPERAVVLHNTVSEAFSPGDGAAQRAAWGLADRKILLTVGRIDSRERYKGHDRVIAALPELVARGRDVAYVVLGSGDDIPRLEALAAAAGVAERVRFLGSASVEALVEAYRAADLFVMPSTGEGFGIVFLEAMACGTPALGFAVGGAADALEGLGETATETDLVDSLDRLLERPPVDRRALAGAVQARFGRTVFATRLRAVIAWLAPPPPAAPAGMKLGTPAS